MHLQAPSGAATLPAVTPVTSPAVSPLLEVERAVQDRAKQLNVDMTSPDGRDRLRTLIAEELERWHAEYRRGRRAFDVADPEALAERAWRNLTGYGPLEPLLRDPDVWEIMINAPASIFCKR